MSATMNIYDSRPSHERLVARLKREGLPADDVRPVIRGHKSIRTGNVSGVVFSGVFVDGALVAVYRALLRGNVARDNDNCMRPLSCYAVATADELSAIKQ